MKKKQKARDKTVEGEEAGKMRGEGERGDSEHKIYFNHVPLRPLTHLQTHAHTQAARERETDTRREREEAKA